MAMAAACFLLLVMVNKPVTVSLPIPEAARTAKVLILHLEGVIVKRNAPAVWNVFWEWPQAAARTSVDNVHFAGYITSLPNAAAKNPKPANFALELPAAAVAAIHRLHVLRLTFVPVGRLPEGGVTITSLRLE